MSGWIHLLGICGIGMARLASQLAHRGYRVTGADAAVAPPASDILGIAGIEARVGYAAFIGDLPDAVVVGNAIREDNPEAVSLAGRGVTLLSMPQAVNRYLLEGVPTAVVAGTHGKTTTTALIGHGLAEAGLSPRVFVGGLPLGGSLAGAGTGPVGVVEGDEYDTAWFDKGAKLLHYRARWAVLTDLEYDHADIYPSVEAIESVFERFLRENVGREATVVFRAANRRLARLVSMHPGVTVGFGPEEGRDIRWEQVGVGPGWSEGRLTWGGGLPIDFRWRLMGEHNLANAAAAMTVWLEQGVEPAQIPELLESFPGVARRMEVALAGLTTVIDDFAHHPTAVSAALATVRCHYPGRPVLAVFEPRSATSRRRVFESEYARALAGADAVWLIPATRSEQIPPEERIDLPGVAAALSLHGVDARIAPAETAGLVKWADALGGPVIIVMTSGPSRQIVEPLVAALR